MGELTERVLDKINSAKTFEDLGDGAWMTSDLMRRSLSADYHSGFDEIDREDIGEREGTQLRNALLNALPRNADPGYVCSILDALRRTGDAELLPLWVEYLAKYLALLKASNGVVYTSLLALRDLNEPVFKGASSLCVIDVERNVKEAQDYLRRHGITVPG
jgi:hypothetical protein